MAFATTTDVAARLEQTSLSATETATATQLLDEATSLICGAASEVDEAWFTALPTVPKNRIKGLAIRLVARAMASPQGLERAREQLGAYEREETYGSGTVMLTPEEEKIVQKVAGVSGSGSVRVPSLVHDVYVREP